MPVMKFLLCSMRRCVKTFFDFCQFSIFGISEVSAQNSAALIYFLQSKFRIIKWNTDELPFIAHSHFLLFLQVRWCWTKNCCVHDAQFVTGSSRTAPTGRLQISCNDVWKWSVCAAKVISDSVVRSLQMATLWREVRFRILLYMHKSSPKQHDILLQSGFGIYRERLSKLEECNKKKGFQKHETSCAHREAVFRYVTAPATALGDIGEFISEQHYLDKFKNRKVLLMRLSNVRYLARQSLPLRGNWDESSKAEENSNFQQLIKLRSQQDPEILEWLQRKSNKYTSPEIQNELLEAMALGLLRETSANIQSATFHTIMADETADISNKEQLVICILWVDENFVVHEDFLGIHSLERTTADNIVFIIKDVLLRMNLKIQNARGQCYDGAATMAGKRKGVATQIKAINGKCLIYQWLMLLNL